MDPIDDVPALSIELERFRAALLAHNTRKSYADSWKRFDLWCAQRSRQALPTTGETLALWATAMLVSGLRVGSVEVRISGVASVHKKAGFVSPIGVEVRSVLNGARRMRRENPRQKRALTIRELERISRTAERTTKGIRDRAIILLGFAGAFRRSELAGLDLADVAFVSKGLSVHLRSSKTDQKGEGRFVGIFRGDRELTCPVRALKDWLECRGGDPGPLFFAFTRGDHMMVGVRLLPTGVVDALKRAVKRIGLNPRLYAGHSLRSGYCTAAAENGATEIAIMQRTGHKSVQMVHRYVRPVSAFASNPLAGRL